MKAIGILLTTVLSTVAAFAAAPTSAQAQTIAKRDGWIQVASVLYPGGTLRMDIPFAVDVETRQVAVVVPQYCAPRAIASRAIVLDDFGGNWTHFASLRFAKQSYVGGFIHAIYNVVDEDGFGADAPFVRGLQFSFAQVNPGFARACRLDFYALPARD